MNGTLWAPERIQGGAMPPGHGLERLILLATVP